MGVIWNAVVQVADGNTSNGRARIRKAVADAPQVVQDAAEEIIFCARIGIPVPQELQGIINKWQAGELAQDKYGR